MDSTVLLAEASSLRYIHTRDKEMIMRIFAYILLLFLVFGCSPSKPSSKAPTTAGKAKQVSKKRKVKSSKIRTAPIFTVNDFVRIEAGVYEYPIGLKTKATKVTLTTPYLMKKTEVTQDEWHKLMGTKPSAHKGCPTCPVERVSYADATRYANRVSKAAGLEICYGKNSKALKTSIYDCKGYRLPTEAEWVYVAQLSKHKHVGTDDAWVAENSNQTTHPVAQKLANASGLFDLHGNVWEWCHDVYEELPAGHSINPQGPATGRMNVSRGGSWRSSKAELTPFRPRYSHLPNNKTPTRGFRLARSLR